MAQEDKIKRELDRIGMIIGMLINKFLDKHNFPEETVKDIMQQAQDELDIDLEAFFAMDKEERLNFLVNQKKFSIENLRNFGDLLYELGHKSNDGHRKDQLLTGARDVYEYVSNSANGTLFLDVEYRVKELRAYFTPPSSRSL